jgi:hypothetical protein
VLRPAKEREVACAGELGELVRRIGGVHRGDGGENVRSAAGVRERLDDEAVPHLLVLAAKLREVDLREQDVVLAGSREQLEAARVDALGFVDGPRVERIPRVEEVRELGLQRLAQAIRKRPERDAHFLGPIGEERTLTAGLGNGRNPEAVRPPPAAQHLQRLDEVVDVVDLDRLVAAEERRERLVRADRRAGVRDRRARPRGRAPDSQADDRLLGLCKQLERGPERGRSPHGLDEETDRSRRLVIREERADVGHVARRLGAGRDDAAEADSGPERRQRLSDRAGLDDRGDPARRERARQRADPGRRLLGDGDAHAVRPEQGGAELPGARGDAPRDEGADSRCRRVLERRLDASVTDEQECELRDERQVGSARCARDTGHLPPARMDADDPGAAARHVQEHLRLSGSSVRRADDRERAREEKRTDSSAQLARC